MQLSDHGMNLNNGIMKFLNKSDMVQIREIIRDYSNIFQVRSSDSKAIKFMAMRTADLMSKIEKELENDDQGVQ